MQSTSTPIGKTLVSRLPDQRVAESNVARLRRDQAIETLPDALVEIDVIGNRFREKVRVEARAEHCRIPKDRAVARRESVDVSGDHRLDRVRQRFEAPGLANGF